MNILILYSGGLDSLIMKRYAEVKYPEAKVHCVFYDIGQEYVEKERAALPPFVEQRVLPWLTSESKIFGKEGTVSGQIFIPGRNLLLAVAAACQFLPDEIWLGALLGETHEASTDKNWTFLKKTTDVLQYVLSPFDAAPKVRFPLAEDGLNKLTATQWALENGITADQIHNSSSCLSGEPGRCGRCVVCLRRWGIFNQLGIPETYNVDPLQTDEMRAMVNEMTMGSHYDEHRCSEILPALPKSYFVCDDEDDFSDSDWGGVDG